jgi:hypothetical protein
MPIIVDEVVISPATTAAGPVSTDERQAIVAECVERVLDILQQKAER